MIGDQWGRRLTCRRGDLYELGVISDQGPFSIAFPTEAEGMGVLKPNLAKTKQPAIDNQNG
jgi:hypothetical protein